ncbi:MAG: hypothetical protein K0S86_5831 [Geminicoccaceae bacterium]|nr:hypothetical protein [Geminicoccaceae bacterium]
MLACASSGLALGPVRLGDADEPECRMRGRTFLRAMTMSHELMVAFMILVVSGAGKTANTRPTSATLAQLRSACLSTATHVYWRLLGLLHSTSARPESAPAQPTGWAAAAGKPHGILHGSQSGRLRSRINGGVLPRWSAGGRSNSFWPPSAAHRRFVSFGWHAVVSLGVSCAGFHASPQRCHCPRGSQCPCSPLRWRVTRRVPCLT